MATTDLLPAKLASRHRSPGRQRLVASAAAVVVLALLASGCINNGVWTPTALNTPPTAGVTVTDVSCSDQDGSCTAVGSTGFVEVWDGVAWSLGTRPPAVDGWGRIDDVECGSSSRCLAVVQDESGPVHHPHLLAWDGVSWTDFLGHPLDLSSEPTPFSCPQLDSCLVIDPWDQETVGWTNTTVTATPFGTTPPPVGLLGCGSTSSCIAVSDDGTHVSSWNGTLWSDFPPAAGWQPEAISCWSNAEENCMAIGHDAAGTASIGGWWNNGQWVLTPASPRNATTWTSFSCAGGRECIGLGVGLGADPAATAWISFYFDTWYDVTVPPEGADAKYGAISCTNRWCMAVGQDLVPTHELLASYYTYEIP